jgi:hypothetical protein
MTKKFKLTIGTTVDTGSVEHGFNDRFGRGVGYMWRIRQLGYTELTDSEASNGGYYLRPDDAPLLVFEMSGSPTRAGRRYGASSSHVEFATLEEARRAAIRRAEQAAKRDGKKFAKVPA